MSMMNLNDSELGRNIWKSFLFKKKELPTFFLQYVGNTKNKTKYFL